MTHIIHPGISVLRSLVATLNVSESKSELLAFAKTDPTLANLIDGKTVEDAVVALEYYLENIDEKILKSLLEDSKLCVSALKQYIANKEKEDKERLRTRWGFEEHYWDPKMNDLDELFIIDYNWHRIPGWDRTKQEEDEEESKACWDWLKGIETTVSDVLKRRGWDYIPPGKNKNQYSAYLTKEFGDIKLVVWLYTGDHDDNGISFNVYKEPEKKKKPWWKPF